MRSTQMKTAPRPLLDVGQDLQLLPARSVEESLLECARRVGEPLSRRIFQILATTTFAGDLQEFSQSSVGSASQSGVRGAFDPLRPFMSATARVYSQAGQEGAASGKTMKKRSGKDSCLLPTSFPADVGMYLV